MALHRNIGAVSAAQTVLDAAAVSPNVHPGQVLSTAVLQQPAPAPELPGTNVVPVTGGITNNQLLVVGALGIGALFLFTRKKGGIGAAEPKQESSLLPVVLVVAAVGGYWWYSKNKTAGAPSSSAGGPSDTVPTTTVTDPTTGLTTATYMDGSTVTSGTPESISTAAGTGQPGVHGAVATQQLAELRTTEPYYNLIYFQRMTDAEIGDVYRYLTVYINTGKYLDDQSLYNSIAAIKAKYNFVF